ncbi:hypothetical protein SATMO3_56040 [Sporomusa aerivorans]
MKECCGIVHQKGSSLLKKNKTSAVACSPILISKLTYEGTLLQVSYIDPVFGLLPQNITGKNMRYFPPAELNYEICTYHLNRAFANAKKETFQLQTGKRFYHISLLPEKNGRQEVESVLGVVYDITKKQRVIAKLSARQDNQAHVQQIAKLGYFVWNPDCATLYWSDQQYRNFGFEPQEFVPTLDFLCSRIHPEDIELLRVMIAKTSSTYSPEGEFKIVKADGSTGWLYARCGTVASKILGITLDITEKKQSEERKKITEKELILLDQLKTRSDYLNRLLTNDYPLEYAGKALSEFGIEADSEYCCFVIQADKTDTAAANLRDGELALIKNQVLIWLYNKGCDRVWCLNNSIILLMPVTDSLLASKQSQLDFARLLTGKITNQFPAIEITMGISGASRIPLNIRDIYEKAYRAAIVAASGDLDRITHFDDIGLYKIAFQLIKDETTISLANNTIGILDEYDKTRGGSLLLTLKCILEDESLKTVAKKLYIHHNTAIWRKHRIEELLGISLDKMETRVILMLHLKVWELQNKTGIRA